MKSIDFLKENGVDIDKSLELFADVNTYNDLVQEKDRKLEALEEIDEENKSEEFQSVLKVLIENEKRKRGTQNEKT